MGTGIAMSGLFLADTLWLQLASTAMATIGWKYYLVFLCLGVVHTIYLYFKLPEVRHPLLCCKCEQVGLTWFLISRLPDSPWKRLMPCSARLWQDISKMEKVAATHYDAKAEGHQEPATEVLAEDAKA